MKNKPNGIFTWCTTGIPRKKSWIAFQFQLLMTKGQAIKQRKYPCGICNKSVSWKQKGIRCENSNCRQRYHIGCQNMCPVEHEQELNKGTWICSQCILPNHNSADSLLISTKDGDDCNSPLLSLGSPLTSSSPTQLHHNL